MKIATELLGETGELTEPGVTEKEVREAIEGAKGGKSPGADRIPTTFLKETKEVLVPILTKIFTASMRLGHMPKTYKEGVIIFIKKPGKKGKAAKDFRPITLLKTTAKCLERVILERIRFHQRAGGLVSADQFGFQKGVGCEDAAFRLTNEIYSGFKKSKDTLAVFVDVSGAYNDLWHAGTIARLVGLHYLK